MNSITSFFFKKKNTSFYTKKSALKTSFFYGKNENDQKMELQFCKKTSVFTMKYAHLCGCFSKTLIFTMNYACFLPWLNPKHIFVQKHYFLQWIMSNFSKHQFLQWIMSLLQQSSDGWLGCLGCCLAGLLGCLASPLFPRRLRPGFPHRLGPPGSKTYEKSMISVQIVKKPNVFQCF